MEQYREGIIVSTVQTLFGLPKIIEHASPHGAQTQLGRLNRRRMKDSHRQKLKVIGPGSGLVKGSV